MQPPPTEARNLRLDAVDPGAEGDELGLDLLVAAVDVLDPRDDRSAGRGQCGEDQRGAGTEVRDPDLGAMERLRADRYERFRRIGAWREAAPGGNGLNPGQTDPR